MEFKKEKAAYIATFVLFASLLLLFLCNPKASSAELFRGLKLCAEALIPTLFPYMVISEMLVRSGTASFISPGVGKITERIFGVSGASGAAILLGLLCGFPVGAKTAADLFDSGTISKEEAEKVMGLCNLPSPPFIIFVVGERLFGSRGAGIFLYFNLLTAILIYGIITRRPLFTPLNYPGIQQAPPIFTVFTESVASAASAVIKVCAFVTFFSSFTGGSSSILSEASPEVKAALFSFFELTSGAAACSALSNKELGFILASAAAGWSGLSVFCQIFSISRAKRGSISMRRYLVSRIVTFFSCAASTAICLKIFPTLLPKSEPAEETVVLISAFPRAFISAVNIIFIISVFIYLIKKLDRQHNI